MGPDSTAAVLAINLLGDLFGAILRHDARTLIGLPIAGAMLYSFCRASGPGACLAPIARSPIDDAAKLLKREG